MHVSGFLSQGLSLPTAVVPRCPERGLWKTENAPAGTIDLPVGLRVELMAHQVAAPQCQRCCANQYPGCNDRRGRAVGKGACRKMAANWQLKNENQQLETENRHSELQEMLRAHSKLFGQSLETFVESGMKTISLNGWGKSIFSFCFVFIDWDWCKYLFRFGAFFFFFYIFVQNWPLKLYYFLILILKDVGTSSSVLLGGGIQYTHPTLCA